MVRFLRIVSFSSCRHGPKPEINNPVRIWNNWVRLCFVFVYVLYYSCDWSHHGIQHIVIKFLVLRYICPSSSFVHFNNGPQYLLPGGLIKCINTWSVLQSQSLVLRNFLVFLKNSFLMFSFISAFLMVSTSNIPNYL